MLTVTAKGRLTLSEDMLMHLGVAPGGKIAVTKLPGGKINMVAASKRSITEVFGLLKRRGAPVLSIAQIKVATADGWSGKARRAPRRPAKK